MREGRREGLRGRGRQFLAMGGVGNVGSLVAPPDGGWGWAVVFGSFMIHVMADGITYTFGVFYQELIEYFKEGKGATSWIASILVGVTLCSGPISSALVTKYGCRAVTIGGALLASASLSISYFANSVGVLYITIGLLTGLGFGLIYLPAIVSVTSYFEKYRSLATGIAVCGSGLGTFIFAPVTEYLVSNLGWRLAFVCVGVLMLSCVLFGALFRPLEPGEMELPEVIPPPENNGVQAEKRRPHSIHGNTDLQEWDPRLAFSQPILAEKPFGSGTFRQSTGVMYRKDVFYSGSLANIAPKHKSAMHLPLEVRKGEEKPLMKKLSVSQDQEVYVTICGCFTCPEKSVGIMAEMLDFSLLKDPIFIIFVVSNFFTSIGFNVPYVYLVAQGNERGISTIMSSYLLSVIGIANTLGRIVLGYFADKPWTNRLYLYNYSLTICGVGSVLSIWCNNFPSLAIYAAVFGFTAGAYVGLTPVILVDLLGLDKLTNAFGILLLFQGFASFIGPPITGWLYDAFNSYDPGFGVAGVMIAISGVMLFVVPSLQRHIASKASKGATATNGHVLSPS